VTPWLFQADPKRYRIRDALQQLDVITYRTGQRLEGISKGDRAFFWESGKMGGLLGAGRVVEGPGALTPAADELAFYHEQPERSGEEPMVRIQITEHRPTPVPRVYLTTRPQLQSMRILSFPRGTKFRLSPEEATALESVLLDDSWEQEWEQIRELQDHPAHSKSSARPGIAAATRAEQRAVSEASAMGSNHDVERSDAASEDPATPSFSGQIGDREYPLPTVASETGIDLARLESWVRAIERKGQAVFYGPPGTGKTFVARHVARHLVGGRDGFVELVQFHPAYAYEDFMQGIRPRLDSGGGLAYQMVPGRFLNFCERAAACSGPCVLIIDEINRANLARVFGELMYLLEYRGEDVPLASGGRLRVPNNVRILGTMNTADRSIALVDHALRRRFAFLHLWPDYDVLRHYHDRKTGFAVDGIVETLRDLNRSIADPHYEVGISYFLRADLDAQIADIWKSEIEPYLEEHFFDQPAQIESYRWDRVAARVRMQP